MSDDHYEVVNLDEIQRAFDKAEATLEAADKLAKAVEEHDPLLPRPILRALYEYQRTIE